MADIFIWALFVHLICDWFLQNEWMALNKVSLRHPASWIHSGIHFVGLLFVFAPSFAAIVAILHLLIDTRIPLQMWRRFYRQTTEGPIMVPFGLWQDQAAHLIILVFVASWAAK